MGILSVIGTFDVSFKESFAILCLQGIRQPPVCNADEGYYNPPQQFQDAGGKKAPPGPCEQEPGGALIPSVIDYLKPINADSRAAFSSTVPMVMRRQLPHIVTELRLRTIMPLSTR